MASLPKKKEPAKKAGAAAAPAATVVAKKLSDEDHGNLFFAVEKFINAESNFESSILINTAVDELGECTNLKDVFEAPLKRSILSMDSALRWLMFLRCAPPRAVEDGDKAFASGLIFEDGLDLISQIYDIGAQAAIWDHFEDDEDDEDEEDEEEDAEKETK